MRLFESYWPEGTSWPYLCRFGCFSMDTAGHMCFWQPLDLDRWLKR